MQPGPRSPKLIGKAAGGGSHSNNGQRDILDEVAALPLSQPQRSSTGAADDRPHSDWERDLLDKVAALPRPAKVSRVAADAHSRERHDILDEVSASLK